MALASTLAPVAGLLREDRRARRFFAAQAQSSLGTGAACVALLMLAHERFVSPWAIVLVLAADMVPPMLLGPLCGAAADRWSRRSCAVAADCVRALAFAGIALVGGFAFTVAFALLAGLGGALFRPAVQAALPTLFTGRRLPAATSLFGAVDDLGYTLGPALCAVALLVGRPELVCLVNAGSFALSALLLARLPFGGRPAPSADESREKRSSLFRDVADGLRAATSTAGIPALIFASSGIVLFAGLINVGELLLATDALHAGGSGYALLVAAWGLGIAAGSLAGSRGGRPEQLKRRYLAGLGMTAGAFVCCGIAPDFATALIAFSVGGIGNGLIVVHERLLFQALVPERLLGRVFSLKDTLQSWAFAPGFAAAGLLASLLGPRALFLIAGGGALVVWALATAALRSAWTVAPSFATPTEPAVGQAW